MQAQLNLLHVYRPSLYFLINFLIFFSDQNFEIEAEKITYWKYITIDHIRNWGAIPSIVSKVMLALFFAEFRT